MPDATPSPEERARALLADQLDRDGAHFDASAVRAGATRDPLDRAAIRALAAALTPSQPDTSAGDVMLEMDQFDGRLLRLRGALERAGVSSDEINAAVEDVSAAAYHAIEVALRPISTPSAGEGLVLVPREPSEEMIASGTALNAAIVHHYDDEGWRNITRAIWSAMIAAAPANPSLSGTGEVE